MKLRRDVTALFVGLAIASSLEGSTRSDDWWSAGFSRGLFLLWQLWGAGEKLSRNGGLLASLATAEFAPEKE
jgi:hypothetical protein